MAPSAMSSTTKTTLNRDGTVSIPRESSHPTSSEQGTDRCSKRADDSPLALHEYLNKSPERRQPQRKYVGKATDHAVNALFPVGHRHAEDHVLLSLLPQDTAMLPRTRVRSGPPCPAQTAHRWPSPGPTSKSCCPPRCGAPRAQDSPSESRTSPAALIVRAICEVRRIDPRRSLAIAKSPAASATAAD